MPVDTSSLLWQEFRSLAGGELAFKGLIRTAEVVERAASNQTGGGNTPTSGVGPAVGLPSFADLEEEHGQRFWNHASQVCTAGQGLLGPRIRCIRLCTQLSSSRSHAFT